MNRFFLVLITALLILFPGCTIQTKRPIQVEIVNSAPAQKVTVNASTDIVWDKANRAVSFQQTAQKPKHQEGCHRDHRKNADCIVPSLKRSAKDKVLSEPENSQIEDGEKEIVLGVLKDNNNFFYSGPIRFTPEGVKRLALFYKVSETKQTNVVLDSDGTSEQKPLSAEDKQAEDTNDVLFTILYSVIAILFTGIIIWTCRASLRRRRGGESNTPPTTPPVTTGCVAQIDEDPTESEPTDPVSDQPQSSPISDETEEGVDNSNIYDREDVLQDCVQPTDLAIARIEKDIRQLAGSTQKGRVVVSQLRSDQASHHRASAEQLQWLIQQVAKLGVKVDKVIKDRVKQRKASNQRCDIADENHRELLRRL